MGSSTPIEIGRSLRQATWAGDVMLMPVLLLALGSSPSPLAVTTAWHPPAPAGELGAALEGPTPIQLALSLRLRDPQGLARLLLEQQDPASPGFHRWVSPAEFGRRFGQPSQSYELVAAWLGSTGLAVRRSPSALSLHASGTAAQVERLLSVELRWAKAGGGRRSFLGIPRVPAAVTPLLLALDGLDVRPRGRRAMPTPGSDAGLFGPQDLRRFYDAQPLLDQGFTGRGYHLAVWGSGDSFDQFPESAAVEYFYAFGSDSAAHFDLDVQHPGPGFGDAWYELTGDSEIISIAAPGASAVTLVIGDYSDIANSYPEVATVSISFCGGESEYTGSELLAAQQAIQQGNAEGQTWFAASGDWGTSGYEGSVATVCFPADIPEVVAVGGTTTQAPFDAQGAITGYFPETGWTSSPSSPDSSGGGVSTFFGLPSWQVGTSPSDGGRTVPDIAFLASNEMATVFTAPTFEGFSGTSAASPFAAGVFALLADRLGGRLGGINPTLYALGRAQLDGGPQVFHDITEGNNSYGGVPGYDAAPGYDLVTGWGSVDVAALAGAWPLPATDGGSSDAGSARLPYDPCTLLGCTSGSTCTTIPEGPSSCVAPCDPAATFTGCPTGQYCVGDAGAGSCLPGCNRDHDCPAGLGCLVGNHSCYPLGPAGAAVGGPCQLDSDCPAGGICLLPCIAADGPGCIGFADGLCSLPCEAPNGVALACPSSTWCAGNLGVCLPTCTSGAECRSTEGYVCQPETADASVCYPACTSDADCPSLGSLATVQCQPDGLCAVPGQGTTGSSATTRASTRSASSAAGASSTTSSGSGSLPTLGSSSSGASTGPRGTASRATASPSGMGSGSGTTGGSHPAGCGCQGDPSSLPGWSLILVFGCIRARQAGRRRS